ncbi:MAG: hypothetical protein ACR2JV_04625 [Gaiellales bacterium]
MRIPRRPLVLLIAPLAAMLAVPAIASADITRTRGCDGTTGGVAFHEEATASVVVTEGDKTIAGGDLADDASPRGALTVTVDASGTGIPSAFTAALGGRKVTGSAPGAVILTAPKAAGDYTIVVVVAAGSACDLSLDLDVRISVGRGSTVSTGGSVNTPDDIASGDDITPPTVVLRPLAAKRGHRLRFPYRVVGERAATVDTIEIRRTRGGAAIVSTDLTSASKGMRRAPLTPPISAAPGAWWWCVTSIDESGNESKLACARLTLR